MGEASKQKRLEVELASLKSKFAGLNGELDQVRQHAFAVHIPWL
jgi:hypothetical protein